MRTVAAKTANIARRHLICPAMTVLAHTHPLVRQLENDLLPLFRAALPPLAAAAPRVLASVFAFSSGTASAFQDFHFGISCLLADVSEVPADAPEEVALLVSVTGLDAGARLSAQVVWGQPSGLVEMQAELEAGDLHAALPGLLASLQQAVCRGRPNVTGA